jgi:hypothetical protein
MPAALRRQLRLRSGQPLLWKLISDTEFRVMVVRKPGDRDGGTARGYMKRFQKGLPQNTAGWMKLLREGDRE